MQPKKSLQIAGVTVIPANVAHEAGQFIQRREIQSLSFWNQLTPSKQETLREEIKQLAAARMMHASSGLAIGKHLRTIYNTCEPYSGAFRKLITNFAFVERTAYRYMETYDNVKAVFPEVILKAAMARGLNVLSYSKEAPLGKYTEAVRLLPPPKNADTETANRYIEQLEQTYKDRKKALLAAGERDTPRLVSRDKKTLLRDSYRGIRNALKSLPTRQRRAFLEELIGMAMTEAGIQSKVSFAPEGIPDDFRREPGRPRLDGTIAAS